MKVQNITKGEQATADNTDNETVHYLLGELRKILAVTTQVAVHDIAYDALSACGVEGLDFINPLNTEPQPRCNNCNRIMLDAKGKCRNCGRQN